MDASDLRKRAKWLEAVARRVGNGRSAGHLASCARAMILQAERIDPAAPLRRIERLA